MADKLNVYKGEEVVGSAERGEDGKASVTINNLEANTDYAAGTYQVAFENENGESEKVDVPSFKTKPISVTGVTLSKESLTLEPGAKGSIEVTVQPSNATNKGVTFTSSNEAVATVDSKGEITAKTEGSADITVKTVDGGKTAKCELTVKKAVVNVTGVKLDKSTLSLEEGATGNLVATVAPSTASDKTVTFASSDAAIATVDNTGKVTAVKAGNADITVTTKDGGKTAKCELTVTAKQIPVTGVTIEPKTASVDVDATTKLNSTVAPSTATNKSVSYKSSDEAVATVSSNGTVTGVAEGEATITVTTQDGNKSDAATVTVNAAEEPEE
jgi:uncharacterized protein YjdB